MFEGRTTPNTKKSEKKCDTSLEKLNQIAEDSIIDCEKQLTLIASGILTFSMFFIEKVVTLSSSTFKWFIIAGWGGLTLSLCLNLFSHWLSSYYANKCAKEKANDNDITEIAKNMNNYMIWINLSTVILLFLGIIGVMTFIAINI